MNILQRYDYIEKFRKCHTVVVHCGVFHADDVFTVAYLQLLRKFMRLQPLKVLRVADTAIKDTWTLDEGYIVADIGHGEFDHHFSIDKKQCRENGVHYAAFGLVVRAFHQGFLNEMEYKRLDEKFIQSLDYHDNNGCGNQLSFAISAFNYGWDECDPGRTNGSLEKFNEAMEVATKILERQIASARSIIHARDIAAKQYVTGNTVFMDQYAPVGEFYQNNPDIKFVGSPSARGGYQIIACKDATGENKGLFPNYCRGMQRTIDNPDKSGMFFCHPSGFMATFINKDAARKYMNIMYSKYTKDDGGETK